MNRRQLVGLLILVLVLAVLAELHLYVGRRLIDDAGLTGASGAVAWAALSLLGLSLVLYPVAERRGLSRVARCLVWPSQLWLGLGFLVLVCLCTSDLGLWILGGPVRAAGLEPLHRHASVGELRALGVLGIALGAGGLAVANALAGPTLRRLDVWLDRAARGLDGFRIVQISDLHIGPILDRSFLDRVVERVNALEPDLVAITGDLVDGDVTEYRAEIAPLEKLRSRFGTFFVTGNHDHYAGADGWVEAVAELGVRVLRNERVRLPVGEAALDLAGVDDYRGGFDGSTHDLERALSDRDASYPVVLLAHDPLTFRMASRVGVDLQLSGHTHGGQIWPFRYAVRLIIPWVAGLHRDGGSQLYVSRGTGFWGPPMRLMAPAEITEIRLRAASFSSSPGSARNSS